MTRQLGLEQYDRICYLYDYGDEWRFYAILKEISSDESSDKEPEVAKEKGDSINQYDPSDTSKSDMAIPEPLWSVLPETAVPTADLRALEDRDDVVHVVILLSLETGFGAVSERFMIQFEDVGYVLENFQPGWQVVERVDGDGKTEAELLGELASAAREWHAEIVEISGAMTGQHFDEETVEAMNVELDAELDRKGYGHLWSSHQVPLRIWARSQATRTDRGLWIPVDPDKPSPSVVFSRNMAWREAERPKSRSAVGVRWAE